ncbi:MAG: GNAT family N-acetyltransferase [Cognatishimia sp.]
MKELSIHPIAREHLDAVAKIWHDGWHEAHDHLVPKYPPSERSVEQFQKRLVSSFGRTRVASLSGVPVGLVEVESAEIAQLFVNSSARRLGMGKALLRDAEKQLKKASYLKAWLTVVDGNHRACDFYEKCNWVRTGELVRPSNATRSVNQLRLWRFEKTL